MRGGENLEEKLVGPRGPMVGRGEGEDRVRGCATSADCEEEVGVVVEALGVATLAPDSLDSHVLSKPQRLDVLLKVAGLERGLDDLRAGPSADDGEDLAEVAARDGDLAAEGDVGQARVDLLGHEVAHGAVVGLTISAVIHDRLVDEGDDGAEEEVGFVALHIHVEDGVVGNGDGAAGARVERDAQGEKERCYARRGHGEGDLCLSADGVENGVGEEGLATSAGAVQEEDVAVASVVLRNYTKR